MVGSRGRSFCLMFLLYSYSSFLLLPVSKDKRIRWVDLWSDAVLASLSSRKQNTKKIQSPQALLYPEIYVN